MIKKIWMCWFQGEDDQNIPKLNRECINLWKELNPDWQVNVLCDKTISNYVPEYFDIVKASPKNRTRQAKSDLLRILLLSKYGGVWVDASVYPMLPLSRFYDKVVNKTGFFSYRFMPRGSYDKKKGLCEIVSWFLCVDKPNHYIIEEWKINFIDKFKNLNKWLYYAFHQTLTDLYDQDTKIRHIIDNMIQIGEDIPHSAIQKWENRKDSYMYKRPTLIK